MKNDSMTEEELERAANCSCVAMKLFSQSIDENNDAQPPEIINTLFVLGSGQDVALTAWARNRLLWQTGTILRVRFINGDSRQRAMMKDVMKRVDEWCGIGLREVKSGTSECRIGFDLGAGHWSYVGRDNRSIPQHQKTCNIGLRGSVNEDERDRVGIHELFHFLGLGHEHQHPRGSIPWNRPNVYSLYGRTQGWSRSQIDQQVLNRESPVGMVGTSDADKDSIMMYPIDKALVTDHSYAVGWNTKPSALDLVTLRQFYP